MDIGQYLQGLLASLHGVGEVFTSSNIAVFVASIAAMFTAYQSLLLRKHNRLSVKPHLSTWTRNEEDGTRYIIYFCLENNGLGPAIIKDFIVYFDGEKIGDNHDGEALKKIVNEKVKEQGGILRNTISTLGRGFAFPTDRKEVVFAIHMAMHMGFDKELYKKFVDRFDLDITYTSVYGEPRTLSTKDEEKA